MFDESELLREFVSLNDYRVGEIMIPLVEILRVEENPKSGTFSCVLFNTEAFCVCLEPPDMFNKKDASNVPPGQYICKRVDSPKYGNTFEIANVPGRDHVLFHPGNDVDDTIACILLAQHFGKLGEKRAVLNSGATFDRFLMKLEEYNEFNLRIKEVY